MFARIQSDAVAELFTPPPGVSIAECFNAALLWVDVTTVSPAPQPGWTATETAGVWSFAPPAAAPAPNLAQQATAALAAGLGITSASTPALNGTYAVDATTLAHIQAETISILLNGTFADGTQSVTWPDLATPPVNHAMTVAQFKSFASAASAYTTALFKCQNGTLAALPANSVAIA